MSTTNSKRVNWRTCAKHGDENPHVWGCPECVRELREENKRLRGLLAEAADCVADWGAYASDYFQRKHDLAADIKRFRKASLMPPNASSAP